MPSLPEPTGPYTVAATSFVRPVPREQRPVIGSARVRADRHTTTPDGPLEPALSIEEFAFTIFYPAEVPNKRSSWFSSGRHGLDKGMDWFVHPIAESIRGYEHFAGNSIPGGPGSWMATLLRSVIHWYGSTIKIPVYEHAPLLAPPADLARWPLVLFSHGLGGTRTTYSTLCADLASRGRIVVALEHRDGTGPAVFPQGRTMPYIVPDEVVWPDGNAEEEWTRGAYNSERAIRFRNDQLDFRRREVYEALRAVRLMSTGKKAESGLQALDTTDFDFSRWVNCVNNDAVDLVGHSFGGATILSVLSEPPAPMFQEERLYERIPIRQTLLLDPWMEPLAKAGPKPYSDGSETSAPDPETKSQLLILDSEYFTLWKSHFVSTQEAAAAFAPSRTMTLLRTEHTTFSDVAALTPRRFQSTDGPALLHTICRLADAFLKREVPMEGPVRLERVKTIEEMKIEDVEVKGKKKRRIVGAEGDLLLH